VNTVVQLADYPKEGQCVLLIDYNWLTPIYHGANMQEPSSSANHWNLLPEENSEIGLKFGRTILWRSF
jgi:hypothetical protein